MSINPSTPSNSPHNYDHLFLNPKSRTFQVAVNKMNRSVRGENQTLRGRIALSLTPQNPHQVDIETLKKIRGKVFDQSHLSTSEFINQHYSEINEFLKEHNVSDSEIQQIMFKKPLSVLTIILGILKFPLDVLKNYFHEK